MKRSAWLAGLLGLGTWAGACRPVEAPASVVGAAETLRKLSPRSVPCPAPQPARQWTSCEVYAAPPAQLLPLLKEAYAARAVPDGQGWRLTARDDRNVSLLVRSTPGGTLVNFRRLILAEEKRQGELHAALTKRLEGWNKRSWWAFFRQPDCADLGLRNTAWYGIESCRYRSRRTTPHHVLKGEPVIEIALRTAADPSIPLHRVRRFGYTGNSCQLYELF